MKAHSTDTLTDAAAFYDALSEDYDSMTDRARRVVREAEALRPIVEECGISSAADMGCGTGIHSFALASIGVRTTGFDVSEGMLGKAAAYPGVGSVEFRKGDFLTDELGRVSPLDAVFCLGNSLPHVESTDALRQVFSHWKSNLAEHGRIIVQLLNYDRVLNSSERIVAVSRAPKAVIVRFYDFTRPRITFNILAVYEGAASPSYRLQSTLLYPFRAKELSDAAESAGYAHIDLFSTLKRDPWNETSRDTVLFAGL